MQEPSMWAVIVARAVVAILLLAAAVASIGVLALAARWTVGVLR